MTDWPTEAPPAEDAVRLEMPAGLRAAMEAAHVDADAVLQAAQAPDVLPSDADSAFVEAARSKIGMRCTTCKSPVLPDDPNVLREIVGWMRPHEPGRRDQVVGRRETGGLMCGSCATRLQHGLPPQQETLL